ncbi:hypothetical protein DRW48_10470 [Paracoccus suum]|uniref:Uncharacterized protein n=1 Tax=Paracoccus suum TaxID=2259340 RepID=A0A344PL03_9RHOB|nr:hypothetical protein [Paracoccus suum]AXC50058.1 hypothetical protein DRW48_10470 [Paracoccus suum]
MLDSESVAAAMLDATEALIAKHLSPVLKENEGLRQANAALVGRIAALEAAAGDDGLSEVRGKINEMDAALKRLGDAEPAVTLTEIKGWIAESTAAAVAALPPPEPGLDGLNGQDGTSVDLGDVMPLLTMQVQSFLEALPLPEDGKDGEPGRDADPAEVERLVAEAVSKAVGAITVKDGSPGKDGVGLAGALIDREGCLVVTLTNGETRSLGRVVGEPGRDGQDGLGFDDLTLDYDGERTITFLFQKGERIEERHFVVPVVLDRGVYAPGAGYQKGDSVTFGGSVWIAQRETKARPDGSSDWRLSVKKGRDGKDGVAKAPADRSPLRVGGGNAD